MRWFLVSLFACGGCAIAVRVHAGAVADRRGAGFEAGVSLGFGKMTRPKDGVKQDALLLLGDISGETPGKVPRLGIVVDYMKDVADSPRTWRIGVGLDATGNDTDGTLRGELRGAYLFRIGDVLTAGPELGIGGTFFQPDGGGDPSAHLGATLDLTLPIFPGGLDFTSN